MGVKILSLFDGMACGYIAMQKANIDIEKYIAYEVDKYAIQTAKHNFPQIEEYGDVFKADFTQYKDIDWLIGGSPCVPAGSKVKTNIGYKNIEDLSIGDMVLTHKNRYRPVSRLYQRQANHLYHIKYNGNCTLDLTGNHPIYTYRNGEFKFIRTDELTTNDYVCININQQKEHLDYSNDVLWLIGRALADGYMLKDKKGVSIAVGQNKIEEFETHLSEMNYYVCHKDRPAVDYIVNNSEVVELYSYFGNHKALDKFIPDSILNLSQEQLSVIFEGYISGDGHKRKDRPNTVMWCSSSRNLILSIGLITAKLFGKYPTTSIRAAEYKKLPSGFCQTHESYNSQISITDRYNPDIQIIDDKLLVKIKNIDREDIDVTVYNIETAEDHSYTVNNCIVHNCTYWSIAQKNNRETTASGLGWELFSQYVRALREVKPKYFIYENNKSMSKEIRASITETFGFEPICINSALVSAQNRQRLYWVGIKQSDDTYKAANISQPEDKGILLKDILISGYDLTSNDKSFCQTVSYNGACAWNTIECNQRNMVAEPVCVQEQVYGRKADESGVYDRRFEARKDFKTGSLTQTNRQNSVAVPVRIGALPRPNGELSTSQAMRIYSVDGKSVNLTSGGGGMGGKTGLYAIPIYEFMDCKIRENAHIAINENAIRGVQNKNNASCAENFYEFTDRKANTLTTAHIPKIIDNLENYIGYATPCEWDENGNPIKAISYSDGKTYIVYEVKNGQIIIKSKRYPIKLNDGYYIIRKLTVEECKRLQTVPEWYEFPVSDSQVYKMLGNGWTVDVIVHLINSVMTENSK